MRKFINNNSKLERKFYLRKIHSIFLNRIFTIFNLIFFIYDIAFIILTGTKIILYINFIYFIYSIYLIKIIINFNLFYQIY